MLSIKYKGLIAISFVLLMGLYSPVKVAAATPSRCTTTFSSSGGVYACNGRADQFPSASGSFDDDKCYELRNSGFGPVYFEKPCDQSPFTNINAAGCKDGSIQTGPGSPDDLCANHGGVSQPSTANNLQADCSDPNPDQSNCGIVGYLVTFINVLSALVGIIIVIMIAIGGIQYSTARDNPQGTAAAKGRILNAILALIFYLFAFSILQWLVPGGIF